MLIQCNTIEQYHPLRAALYARVSSEQQAQAGTIDSQIAAILTRAAEETVSIEPELRFVDDGHSGATLVRPALERLRDQAAAGAIDRLYVLCPDRLARSYAYQMLLVDELQKCGVELLFLNHPLGKTPEDNLLLQVQGMVAEYERAKIIERGRRGKLHAARQGRVNVMGKAPYGYRYLPASGGETARYQVEFAQASVVQEIFQWVAHERLSLKQACKRLEKQGVLSPSGKGRWNTSTLLGMLRNPAYKGLAAFGRRRNGPPIRPRLRVRRNGHEHPRNGQGSYRTPSQEWISIPVPSIVDEALFEAVSEQLAQNRQRHRQGQRPIRHLLAQLLVCKCCGYAYGGRYNGGAARKCKYSYYRCAGTEAHRFGGQKVCENKSLRQDQLDAAVWNDVRSLLSDPARVQEELQRRIAGDQPDAQAQAHKKLSGQIEKVRRAIARLIDAYGEGLMDKSEFEPRIKSARMQLAQGQEQLQQQIDQQTRAREMRLLIDNLQAFSRQVASGLENADWATRRQIITTLVKRVEIEPDQVTIVYRVNLDPFDPSPRRGIMHYRSARQTLPKRAKPPHTLSVQNKATCHSVPHPRAGVKRTPPPHNQNQDTPRPPRLHPLQNARPNPAFSFACSTSFAHFASQRFLLLRIPEPQYRRRGINGLVGSGLGPL